MGEYDTATATALRLIRQKGRTVTVQRATELESPSDPDKPWRVTQGDPDEYEAKAVFFPYTTNRQDIERIDQDEQMLIAVSGLDTELAFTDRIVDTTRSRTLSIMEFKKLQPGEQGILYDCRVRQWLPITSQQ